MDSGEARLAYKATQDTLTMKILGTRKSDNYLKTAALQRKGLITKGAEGSDLLGLTDRVRFSLMLP